MRDIIVFILLGIGFLSILVCFIGTFVELITGPYVQLGLFILYVVCICTATKIKFPNGTKPVEEKKE